MQTISLRVYLAAHAPAEPQFWFKTPVMPESPKEKWVVDCDDADVIEREFITIHEARVYMQATGREVYDYNQADRLLWKLEFEKQRLLQWPLVWADEQIKLLGDDVEITYFKKG